MKFHMRMDVRGFLRNNAYPKDYRDVFTHDSGRPMTPSEAHDELLNHIQQGHNFIPMGECDNFDFVEKGCLGHDEDDDPQPGDDS
jgi:hypothetical protein